MTTAQDVKPDSHQNAMKKVEELRQQFSSSKTDDTLPVGKVESTSTSTEKPADATKEKTEPTALPEGIKPIEKAPEPASDAAAYQQQIDGLNKVVKQLQEALGNENRDTYKRRWEVADGMLKSQGKEIKALKDKIQELETKAAESQPLTLTDLDKVAMEKAGLDEDSYLAIKKAIMSGSRPATTTKPEEKPEAKETVETTNTHEIPETTDVDAPMAVENAYFDQLDTLAKNWRVHVKDPDCLKFFNGYQDEQSGKLLMTILKEANSVKDAPTVAKLYNLFEQYKTNLAAKPKTADRQPHPDTKGPGARDVKDDKKPYYSQKDINQWFRDLQQGKLEISSEDAEKLKQEFTLAAKEGRIVD